MSFASPTRVEFGPESLSRLGIEAKALGERALIVSDPGVSAAGLLDLVLGPLQAAGLDVATFSDVESNPTIGNVEATVAAIDAHHADLLIAVGGGSPIDTAKAAVLVAANGGTITDYEGFNIAERAALPLLAIPSTCGTGSEVTKGSVITDPGAHHKMVIVDDGLYPRSAFLDARMIETLPAHLVAATGVDALTHAIEGFITPAANAFSDALNIDAIGRVARHLRPATAGSAPDRYEMMVTASMAGAGFHNVGLGLVHALAVTAGGHFGLHHGLSNAVLLTTVMEFNLIANPTKFARITAAMGEPTDGLSEIEAARRSIDVVQRLLDDVGIPRGLAAIGVEESAIPAMAKDALEAIDRGGNPRSNNLNDLEMLYRAAM